MVFKIDWEKKDTIEHISTDILNKMVRICFPDKKLVSSFIISGGCANLNIKIQLKDELLPYILRIYLRDKNASYKEQNIAILIKKTVPIPQIYFIGDYQNYRFSIAEFIPGITLRDLLLKEKTSDITSIMYEVGEILAKINAYKFSKNGFFKQNLNIIEQISHDNYLEHAKKCLEEPLILELLAKEKIIKIQNYIKNNSHLLPDETKPHLVHGDFDPANILVDNIKGEWKVTGILDWEFAFSGSILWDVANMLRYRHKMPAEFQEGFLRALEKENIYLAKDFIGRIDLLNLMALLDCLARTIPQNNPNQCTDICELIDKILT